MEPCQNKTERCINCHDHFQQLRPLIKEIIVTHHFKRDLPDFNTSQIVDCDHSSFTRLHKFEETIDGNHLFRAIKGETHIIYAIDKNHRLIFLRAFTNFKDYKKFLNKKKEIISLIEKGNN